MTAAVQHWLMKSEPDVFGIEDLRRDARTPWEGVRNYQARNFMRDSMRVGDRVLFYHSNATPPGVAGLAAIASAPRPDPSAFDSANPFYDPRSTPAKPVWMLVDVAFVAAFARVVSLAELRQDPQSAGMLVTRRGMRLSIQPVTPAEYAAVLRLAGAG